jgi:hypothetical protein
MYIALSIFHRMAARLGALNATRKPGPDSQVAPRGRARARVAVQVKRAPTKWQLHGQPAQTPSNLM